MVPLLGGAALGGLPVVITLGAHTIGQNYHYKAM